jgi:hypothetical protein
MRQETGTSVFTHRSCYKPVTPLPRTYSVHWKVRLEPGGEKTLNYQYERYVPTN